MRAARVISMLFALQHQGRITASELASQLEVSVRTVLRDVETLGEAGVPIYAVQGAGGGIELLDGFAESLTTMTVDDAAVLLLAGQPRLAAALGLATATASARHKLLAALPPALASEAASLDSWFLHDPAGRGEQPRLLRMTVRAIQARTEMKPMDDTRPAGLRRPLGLVLEVGDWQLVHLAAAGPRVHPLMELTGDYVMGRRFTRPAGFDLSTFWAAARAGAGSHIPPPDQQGPPAPA